MELRAFAKILTVALLCGASVLARADEPGRRYAFELETDGASNPLADYLDFNRYFSEHPEKTRSMNDLLEATPSPEAVKDWPMSRRREYARYAGAHKGVSEGVAMRDYWSSLSATSKRKLFSPNSLEPRLRRMILARLLGEAKWIRIRRDAPADWLRVAERFEWEEDAKGILEFRNRSPSGQLDSESAALKSLIGLMGGTESRWEGSFEIEPKVKSLHFHLSDAGKSLRKKAALWNLFAATELQRQFDLFGNGSVAFNSVDTRGLLRLYDPDRVEFRTHMDENDIFDPKDLLSEFDTLSQLPERYARAVAGKRSDQLLEMLGSASQAGVKESKMRGLSEGIAAIELYCPGCLAKNGAFMPMARFLLDDENPVLARNAAYVLAHLHGLPPELSARVGKKIAAEIDRIPLSEIRLGNYTRIPLPEVRKAVMRRASLMRTEDRYAFIGTLDELVHPDYKAELDRALSTLNSKNVQPRDALLFNTVSTFPEDRQLRARILSFLESPNHVVRQEVVAALARVPRFLDDSEAEQVLKVALSEWSGSTPSATEMRMKLAQSGELRWLLPMLRHEIRESAAPISQELRLSLKGPAGDALQQKLGALIREGDSTRARSLELAAGLEDVSAELAYAISSAQEAERARWSDTERHFADEALKNARFSHVRCPLSGVLQAL